ncbi:hypothetical protein ID866_6703 [Astraeus odoratus]|nr:hypothetical protein ID866_6703 [Astraeus odoratus]
MSSEDAGRPPSTVAGAVSVAALDSLLSPKGPSHTLLSRESVAESEYSTVPLEDDPRFSTVPLSEASERASIISLKSEPVDVDELSDRLERRTTISSTATKPPLARRHFAHKKSASSITANDVARGNILARLSPQKAHDENDIDTLRATGRVPRGLHEEFLRLHNERRAEATKNETDRIDWDFWGAVISDYQGGHFLPEMPKLQLRLFQFDRLIEELLPVLHVHFLRQGVKSSMFCSQWFPLEIVFRIYDTCLASGIEAIFAFSIALLQKNEETLLSMKFDEILVFLKQRVFDPYKITPSDDQHEQRDHQLQYRVDDFVQDATSLKITPFMLDAYAQEYHDLVRRREAHAIEMDNLRNANRALAAKVKELDATLAQLNAEHVDVLNQLVMTRLQNEEMEQELVRYKLLWEIFSLSGRHCVNVPTLRKEEG